MQPRDLISFWFDEVGPKGWFNSSEELDAEVRRRFHDLWVDATEGGAGLWLTYPNGVLAYLLLTDQFPRNMFRDTAQAFATDWMARAAAKAAIKNDWDLRVSPVERGFFYLPLMHSETLTDQERAVRLYHSRMPDNGGSMLLHARAHRRVIREFGRFPFRNAALDRPSTEAEIAFLAAGGYGSVVRQLQAEEQAAS